MDFPLVRLSDLCDLLNGYAFKSEDYIEISNTLSCRMSNIRPNGEFNIDYNPRFLPDNFAKEYSDFLLKDGDIVVAMTDLADAPQILGVPTIIKTNGKNILLNQRVGKLLINENQKIHIPYLKYALTTQEVRALYKKFACGGLQINLSKKDLLSIEIPLPPLPIQRHIARVLDQADQLRKQAQQMEIELSALAQSVFLEMFGDPVTNPKGWVKATLEKIASIQLGKMLSKESKTGENSKLYLRNANIRWNYIDISEVFEMDFTKNEQIKFSLVDGDLLVCEGGEVGRCAIWRNQLPECYFQKALHRVRCDANVVTPEYLQSYFYFMSKMGGLVSSTSEVTFSHLTLERIKILEVPLPPIDLQKKFVSLLTVIEKQLVAQQNKNQELDTLFNSLIQKAFKGELIPSTIQDAA